MPPKRRTYWAILKAILSFGALAIAYQFYYYLTSIETDIKCFANSDSDFKVDPATPKAVDVNSNFATLFKYYAIILLVDCFREFLGIFYFYFSIPVMGIPIRLLYLTAIPHLVLLVMNHMYRLSHEGRVCSGSFLTDE